MSSEDPWIGQTIGTCQIISLLGRGGMGRVYRGHHTRLGRDVALKVLESAEPVSERAAMRFKREARILAALNHPNIGAIYDIEEHAGRVWMVLELATGPTLADRLRRGAMPLAEVLPIATQVARAIEFAHEKGVVHRDLKPANIALAVDGPVKVLDFGIAKIVDADTGDDAAWGPQDSVTETREGQVVGTIAYMSPEQVRGRAVDRRTDIWAFGVLLFEMLTGRAPFAGEDGPLVIARIIEAEPDWTRLPPDLPHHVRHLLTRCLTKDPTRRLQAIGEARLLLDQDAHADVLPSQPDSVRRHRWLRWAGVSAGAVLLVVVAWAFASRVDPEAPDLRRIPLPYTDGQLSPDGRAIVERRGEDLYVYSLLDGTERRLEGAEAALNVFWSYDGSAVGFRRNDQLWRVDIAGGAPVVLADLPQGVYYQADWDADDRVVFSMPEGLYEVSARGGTPALFFERDQAASPPLRDPHVLPGGGVLVALAPEGRIDIVDGAEHRSVVDIADVVIRNPRYSTTGHVVFSVERGARRSIWAVPFSVGSGEAMGAPFQVVPGGTFAYPARDGSLLYQRSPDVRTQMVWVDRSGTVLEEVGPLLEGVAGPALSPDETRIALSAIDGNSQRILVLDLASGTMAPLSVVYDGEQDYPFWVGTGDRVGYTALDRGTSTLVLRWLNGRRDGPVLGTGEGTGGIVGSGGFTSSVVTFQQQSEDLGVNLWFVPAGGGDPQSIVRTPQHEGQPRLSRDERYMAYIGGRTGFPDVFVTRFPEGDVRWPVSDGGGREPRWSADGQHLYYWADTTLMEVDVVERDENLRFSAPRPLFDAARQDLLTGRRYGVARDGRFLMVQQRSRGSSSAPWLILLPDWIAAIGAR